jgi:hypothetical protein
MSGVDEMMRLAMIAVETLLLAAALAHAAIGAPTRFPFVMPWNDASKTVVDVSALNPAPIDESRRVVIKDGHFFDRTGRRVRFVGMDLAAGACFPDREDAPQIAARMHKLGINCVRLHHMDSGWAEPNMFAISGGSYGKRTDRLDPQSLDRLDYLIYQFKLHGIYVDMNLHVGRGFNQADGFPDADKIDDMGKVVGYFVPGMVERQKLYARQVLSHLNPYTKATYAEEPAVALIEITNEDSLLASADSVPGLPDYYRNILATGWNQFLARTYGTNEKMLAAWNAHAKPLGANFLRNPQFMGGTEGWTLEQHEGTSAEMTVEPIPQDAGAPTGRALRLAKLRLDGTDWHLQLHQTSLNLTDGEVYTVSFAGRSDVSRTMGVGVLLDEDPWRNVGLDTRIALKPQWQRYSFSFMARTTVPNHVRLSFVFGGGAGDVFLADVALRPGGGAVELASGESLIGAGISLPSIAETPEGWDYVTYLMQVERAFSQGMRDYITRDLGAKAPVACSQASYGGLGGVWREAHMDWVDMHAYWQHPWFPRKDWDSDDYLIGNTSMVRDRNGGTLTELAMHRVAGIPFTVSEYDEPAPSEYAAEMVPLIFSFAAWQDWDGVFLFAYHGDAKGWDRDHIDGFFDQSAHPGKLAFLPAAAEVFLRGYIAPASAEQVLIVPADSIADVVSQRTDYGFWQAARNAHVAASDMVARRTSVRFVDGAGPVQVERRGGGAPSLRWSDENAAEALFTAHSPYSRTAAGFLGGRSVDLDGVTVTTESTPRNFASLALVSMDGSPIGTSRSLTLTAVDKVENAGLEWNAERTFAKNAWAGGPTLAETPSASIELTMKARHALVYALDSTGRRTQQVPATLEGGRLSFRIGPEYRALWYEISAD